MFYERGDFMLVDTIGKLKKYKNLWSAYWTNDAFEINHYIKEGYDEDKNIMEFTQHITYYYLFPINSKSLLNKEESYFTIKLSPEDFLHIKSETEGSEKIFSSKHEAIKDTWNDLKFQEKACEHQLSVLNLINKLMERIAEYEIPS